MKIRRRKTRIIRTAEAIELFQRHGEITPTAAKRLFDTWTAILVCALQQGHKVQIRGLGSFRVGLAKSSTSRNGRVTQEHYRVYFKTSEKLLKNMRKPDAVRQERARTRAAGNGISGEVLHLADADSVGK